MKNRALMFWVAVLFLFVGTMSIMYAAGMMGGRDAVQDAASHGTESADEQESSKNVHGQAVNSFELTDQLGREFRSDEMLGKIWVASIFFADCPGFCPQQNRQMQLIQNEFGDLGVVCVSITCDPEKDTPRRLLDYSSRFDAKHDQWHFLTGDLDEIKRVGNDIFQVVINPQAHSNRFFVIDREGKIHDSFRSTDVGELASLRKALQRLLTESPATDASQTEAPPGDGDQAVNGGSADAPTE